MGLFFFLAHVCKMLLKFFHWYLLEDFLKKEFEKSTNAREISTKKSISLDRKMYRGKRWVAKIKNLYILCWPMACHLTSYCYHFLSQTMLKNFVLSWREVSTLFVKICAQK